MFKIGKEKFLINERHTMDECYNIIKNLEKGNLIKYYNSIFLDERLHIETNNVMEESPETIRLWQSIGRDYHVSNDKYFFLYALYLYLMGKNSQFGLCFLYALDKHLRVNEEFNDLLIHFTENGVLEFTEDRHITKEEKIVENNGLDLCPFGDAIGSAAHLCRKYNNDCQNCQNMQYEDKLYNSFSSTLKLTNIRISKY